MSSPVALSVIGAGPYGTALAISLARKGQSVLLWGHSADEVAKLQSDRENKAFLPGVAFPPSLSVTNNLTAAVQASRDLLVVVPSHVFGEVLSRMKTSLRSDSRLAWATKGLEPEHGRLS